MIVDQTQRDVDRFLGSSYVLFLHRPSAPGLPVIFQRHDWRGRVARYGILGYALTDSGRDADANPNKEGEMKRKWLFTVLVTFATTTALSAASGPQIVIKEWDIGTPKRFPHDPVVAPDGSLWYTGMTANVLNRYREPLATRAHTCQYREP